MKYSSTELCNIMNVTKKTLRHYNKLEILTPTIIDSNGYWYYVEDDLNRLQIIKNLQTIGYSLTEIKTNFNSDFQELRESLPTKLQYIDEQLIQMELAKRLLKKISIKKDLNPLDAINEILDEEHMEWYRKNLSSAQLSMI